MQVKLPANVEIEQQILGALLLKDSLLFDICEDITADDYFDPGHSALHDAIQALVFGGKRASPALVRDYLGSVDSRAKVDESYLDALTAGVAGFADVPHYARQVADLARRRRLILAMVEGVEELGRLDPRKSSQSVIDNIESVVLGASRVDDTSVRRLGDWARKSVARAIDAMDRPSAISRGLSYGLAAADTVAGRLMPGNLVILGGRPGAGKSAFAGAAAEHFARQAPGLVLSLEMQGEDWAERRMSDHSDIAVWRISQASLNEADIDRLQDSADRLQALPVWIDQRTKLTVDQVRARATRHKHKHNIKWMVIDHLHLIRPASNRQDRLQAVNDIADDLKQLSKDLEMGILALAQLNSQVRDRDDGRPRARDLMYYSSIEPHADVIIFTHRAESALAERKPDPSNDRAFADWESRMKMVRGRAEIINAKRRQGEGYLTCECAFDGPTMRFRDLQEKPRKPAQQEIEEL